jgi:hypothetical protein
MKFREALPGVVVLLIRLAQVDPRRWALDWIAVLAMLWIAITLTREETAARRWSVGLSCAWLAVIYGIHQLPWTFAGWGG